MRLRLAVARRGPAAGLGPAVEGTIAELAEEIAELRSLIAELSPVALEELGLEAALESLAHHHRVDNGLEVTVDLSEWRDTRGPIRARARAREHALPRGPGGARKRRRTRRGGVRRAAPAADRRGGRGSGHRRRRGFEPNSPSEALGLIVLAERLSLVDGSLAVDSAPGTGTTLSARVPV